MKKEKSYLVGVKVGRTKTTFTFKTKKAQIGFIKDLPKGVEYIFTNEKGANTIYQK